MHVNIIVIVVGFMMGAVGVVKDLGRKLMTPTKALEAAKAYVDEHLHELCEELIDWDKNKILKADAKIHKLFELCKSLTRVLQVRFAKHLIYDAAVKEVVRARWDF